MVHIDFTQLKSEAEAAVDRGGDTRWPRHVLKCLARIYELEKELQDSRQLKLFGDVPPPPKTPIGT